MPTDMKLGTYTTVSMRYQLGNVQLLLLLLIYIFPVVLYWMSIPLHPVEMY